jgi:DNA helicase HerA-like ATPase
VVYFTDPGLREQLEALPTSAALIGIGTDGTAIAVDIDTAPHIPVCTGTGGGTTTILRTLAAQFLHQGAHALVLDATRISHLWAKALSTVTSTVCRG